MIHIPRLSEAVYIGMCGKIGAPIQVKTRREIADFSNVLMKPLWFMENTDGMLSGSQCEGFRFDSSDRDIMIWPLNHKLITDLSQITLYRTPQYCVILMEWENLPPGFTRLKMMTPSFISTVTKSCITIHNEIYISSTRIKSNLTVKCNTIPMSVEPHGPCANVTVESQEYDLAFCFQSHHWPEIALPWIQRCQLKKWPPECVLSAIIKEGCHVVPISSMPSHGDKESEWRISFSRPEQMLVYTLNHCQFLCYGLLKIFIKEVINAANSNPCLCSYFMKTLVFWFIQSNSSRQWFPSELLNSFWNCFKLLILWVYKGECPNFFIPQNNMFRVKVRGNTQVTLFNQLYELYCKGISCLLLSPTIGKYFILRILNRTLQMRINETFASVDACLFCEMSIGYSNSFTRNEKEFVILINFKENLLKTQLTIFQATTVEQYLLVMIRNYSWVMLNSDLAISSNRNRVNVYKKATNMMKLASRLGCSSEILHLALFYYRVCAYEKSLKCLKIAQNKWSMPYLMYNGHTNEEMYRQSLMGLPLGERLRKALIVDICLHNNYTYIDELILEQNANCSFSLSIPPFVMLYMLFVLNHHRLGDTARSQQSLQDLRTLLLYDSDTLVPKALRDISWQILGICQQICRDYVGALVSFRSSLQEIPHHDIQKATLSRIQTLNDMLVIYG